MSTAKTILVTGATGYVGNRLIPLLLAANYKVKAVARSYDKLLTRSWASHANVEIQEANLLDYQSTLNAIHSCDIAFYLVHSMNPQTNDFAAADRQAAINFIKAADEQNLSRIIYLAGLGEKSGALSKHLASRAEVSEILQSGKTKTTILRAAMIIGSGSASFEILRYLVERLPIMITPKWVLTPSQPIAIRNVLQYLIGCIEHDETIGKTFDIGGPEIVTYQELMITYAQEVGLKNRLIIPVPVFTPKLSSYWIHLITPVPAYIAQPLAEGLRNPAVCQDNKIREIIPQVLLSVRQAIKLAVAKVQHHQIESHWTDAGLIAPAQWYTSNDPDWAGGTIFSDCRKIVVDAPISKVWQQVVSLGGQTGWYWGNWLWQLRGGLDRLIGGVGLRRGRRHPHELNPGDCIDFWRVKAINAPTQLLLLAEMKLPGEALLEFRLKSLDSNTTELVQTARFLPKGLAGLAYWHAISPLHALVFNGMLRGIAKATNGKVINKPVVIEKK